MRSLNSFESFENRFYAQIEIVQHIVRLAAALGDLRDVEIFQRQIVALIGEHLGAKRADGTLAETAASLSEPATTDEVNLEALSDEEIENLLGNEAVS